MVPGVLSVGSGLTWREFAAVEARTDEAAAELAERGLSMAVSSDFGELVKVNGALREDGYGVLVPLYDPAAERIGRHNGLWIGIQDEVGAHVGVMACRLREVTDLRQAFEDCTFLMGEAPPEGASCSVDAAGIEDLKGPIVFIGALFVHPKRRGDGLARLLVSSIVCAAFGRWKPEAVVALIAERDIPLALRTYGFRKMHGYVRFRDPRWPGLPRYALLSIDRHEVRGRFLKLDPAQPLALPEDLW